MTIFSQEKLKLLWTPREDSVGGDNGQITIIGGSELFTGAPLFSLIAASRMVDMVFLATPESDKGAAEKTILFSKLKSVIWIPKDDIDKYVEKSDAILIGPGMMRYEKEGQEQNGIILDGAGTETRMITQYLLTKFKTKKWVIDGGSLQVMDPRWIPQKAVLTPNNKEYEILFREKFSLEGLIKNAARFDCVVLYKGAVSYVSDGIETWEINGGNAGLTKGGTGDTLAGITVGLLARNAPMLAAAVASYLIKKTAEELFNEVGYNYNADEVAERVFEVFEKLRRIVFSAQ